MIYQTIIYLSNFFWIWFILHNKFANDISNESQSIELKFIFQHQVIMFSYTNSYKYNITRLWVMQILYLWRRNLMLTDFSNGKVNRNFLCKIFQFITVHVNYPFDWIRFDHCHFVRQYFFKRSPISAFNWARTMRLSYNGESPINIRKKHYFLHLRCIVRLMQFRFY